MLCCIPTGIQENASQQLLRLSLILIILTVFQASFALLSFFTSVASGLFTLIGALILLVIKCTKNWSACIYYIALSALDGVFTLQLCGNLLAEDGVNSSTGVLAYFTLFKLLFYVLGVYYCFLCYRELKALAVETSGQPTLDEPEILQSRTFSGEGYRLN